MYTIQLSTELFLGLELIIYEEEIRDLSLKEQEEFITFKAKEKLNNIFGDFHLVILIEKVKSLQLHMHGPLKQKEINYMCDCKH